MDRQLIEDAVNTTGSGVLENSPAPADSIEPINNGSMRDLIQPAAPLAAPTTPTTPAAQTTQAPASTTTTAPVVAAPVLSTVNKDQETVQGQLRQLLDVGSPILKQARDRATINAASRGLQNSTLAAQAGEEAVIGAAAPIAAADASTYSQRALANQTAQNVFGQAAQQFEQNRVLQQDASAQRQVEQALAGDINSRLQLEQAGYNFQLSAQENLARMREIAAQGNIQAKLALQQFDYQSMLQDKEAGHALTLEDKRFQNSMDLMVGEYAQRLGLSEADSKQQIERMNLQHQQTLDQLAEQAKVSGGANAAQYARDLQSAYLTSITQRQNAASAEVQQIYTTQGLTPAQQNSAVQSAYSRMTTDINALSAYFQQSPYWDPGFGVPSGGAPAPGSAYPSPAPSPGGAGDANPFSGGEAPYGATRLQGRFWQWYDGTKWVQGVGPK